MRRHQPGIRVRSVEVIKKKLKKINLANFVAKMSECPGNCFFKNSHIFVGETLLCQRLPVFSLSPRGRPAEVLAFAKYINSKTMWKGE